MSAAKHTTAQKRALFLVAFQTTWGNVSKSCDAAGIGRTTYYQWREYESKTPSPAAVVFRQALADALEATLDMAEASVLTVAQGYQVKDSRVFMVPTESTSIGPGGAIIRTKTHQPQVVPIVKNVGPDAKAAVKFLEAKGKARGWGKALEVTHKGFPDIKTLVIREVTPKPQQ